MRQGEHIEEINPRDLFYVFKRNANLIIIIILIVMIVVSILSYFVIDPRFESNTTIILSNLKESNQKTTDITYDDVLLNQKLVATYEKIMKSKIITNRVIEKLALNVSSQDLVKLVEVNTLEDTEIINIIVRDKDPVIAAKIANEFAITFMNYVSESIKLDNVSIIDVAEANNRPVQPKPLIYLGVAFILGLILGVFIVLAKEYLDTSIKTTEEAQELVNQYPILAVLPIIQEYNIKELMLMSIQPKSPISEAFRTLRTNIQYTNCNSKVQVIQITSALQDEGKSTIATNYAVVLAQSDKKVLVVDGDLRKSMIHKIFNVSSKLGLVSALINTTILKECVESTEVKNLFVMTCGPVPPNPSEMLESKNMKKTLNILREVFDFIIIDSPPVTPVTDALIISKLVDGTIITVAIGTEKEYYKKMIQSLQQVGANILGTVINKAPVSEKDYSKYTYE